MVENGLTRDEGRIGVTPEALRVWAAGLRPDDQVALEATGNSDAIATMFTTLVDRVVVSNPSKARAIAEAKVKTNKVDARILAQLLAAGFLPPVWLPDQRTRGLRRQVTRRAHLVRQWTRIKNQVHAILARNLAPTPPRVPQMRFGLDTECEFDLRERVSAAGQACVQGVVFVLVRTLRVARVR